MSFHLLPAYGIAAAAIAILASMGIRNRRSGWIRERNDNIVDVLLAWAGTRTDNGELSNKSGAPVTASSIRLDLAALGAAVGANAATPASPPVVSAAQTTSAETAV